jgi:hypothetical protein
MKQVAMNSVLDHDADNPTQPFPMSELLRTYLRQSRGGRREQLDTNVEDLWDELGDFA